MFLLIRWSSFTDNVLERPIVIIVLILLAITLRWGIHRVIDRVVHQATAAAETDFATRLGNGERRVQRARTMGDLLKSIVTGALVAVFGTMILSEIGINIAPIIAGAGVVGIALGFGAQSLVKDILSGVFMIFEDQYGVGDIVDIGPASGTVEAVSLRVTRLRDLDGTVWYVPNGTITRVGNKSQNWSRAVVDVQVAPDEDLARVQELLGEAAHTLWIEEAYDGVMIEEPQVTGVESVTSTAATLRVLVKTAPMKQWEVARVLRERTQERLAQAGVRMPHQPWNPAATPPD